MPSKREIISNKFDYDAVLIGAGIMSSTLALLLTELIPEIKILIVEKLDSSGKESTGAFNNAGTGHAANCELNYTPKDATGKISIEKAISINNSFEISLEFWSSLHERGIININNFLKFTPHISFVSGEEDVAFLKKRYQLMKQYIEFEEMEFSTKSNEISSWAPLITKERDPKKQIAATRIKRGTDINFENLTKEYLKHLIKNNNVKICFLTELIDLKKDANNWRLFLKKDKNELIVTTPYVFLGAGGKTISLLQKSSIPESKIYGGFPVSGKWLISDKKFLCDKHNAKVYGKAEIGSPPMSVPHLDARWINNKKYLLYGPFAGFTTKFLKQGSYFDLINSFKKDNLFPILNVGLNNTDLITYLISQSMQTHNSRINNLKRIMPSASSQDWYLKNAGQRVQIIKNTKKGGILKFGTEVVNAKDGSLSALLGASPGASTAVSIMVEVIKNSSIFKKEEILLEKKLDQLISLNKFLKSKNISIFEDIKRKNNSILGFHT